VNVTQRLMTPRADARAHNLTLHDGLAFGVLALEVQLAGLFNTLVRADAILRRAGLDGGRGDSMKAGRRRAGHG